MIQGLRESGIGVVDNLKQATHFCHFYETPEDLLETVVPYFKTGLAAKEYCLWVISEPLSETDAKNALRAAGLDRHLLAGDIEIVSYRDWYLSHGEFEGQRTLRSWRERVAEALAKGYAWVRVSGNTAWVGKNGWKSFAEYEKAINDSISELNMTALCTYSLHCCDAAQVLDVMSLHQLATTRRDGELEVVETSETKKAKAEIERLYRAEEALRRAEQKYWDIFENAGEGIFQTTADGRFLTANPALARMLGFDSPDDLMMSLTNIACQYYVDPQKRAEFKQLLEDNDAVRGFEYQAYRKDGSTIWMSDNVRTVRDQDGALLYYEGTAQDITDRKEAEDELRRQKEILQKIFDYIPMMITFIDADDRTRLVNREWERTLGWSLEEVTREDVDIFAELYPDPAYREEVLNCITEADTKWEDFRTRVRDGRVIDTTWANVLLSDGTSIGIGKDITLPKQAENELREQKEILQIRKALA